MIMRVGVKLQRCCLYDQLWCVTLVYPVGLCFICFINLLTCAKRLGLLSQVCATMPSTSTVSAGGSKPAKCVLSVRGRECIWFLWLFSISSNTWAFTCLSLVQIIASGSFRSMVTKVDEASRTAGWTSCRPAPGNKRTCGQKRVSTDLTLYKIIKSSILDHYCICMLKFFFKSLAPIYGMGCCTVRSTVCVIKFMSWSGFAIVQSQSGDLISWNAETHFQIA